MPEDSRYTTAQSLRCRQFAYWMAVSVPAILVGAGLIQIFQVSPFWSFFAGIVFSKLLNPVVEWFQDWRQAEVTARGA